SEPVAVPAPCGVRVVSPSSVWPKYRLRLQRRQWQLVTMHGEAGLLDKAAAASAAGTAYPVKQPTSEKRHKRLCSKRTGLFRIAQTDKARISRYGLCIIDQSFALCAYLPRRPVGVDQAPELLRRFLHYQLY